MKYERSIAYHSEGMANVKSLPQTNRQTIDKVKTICPDLSK